MKALEDIFRANKNIVINADLDGFLSGMLLQKYYGCEVVGFSNSRDKVWLKEGLEDIYSPIYIDMYVNNPDTICIEQHVSALNAEHFARICEYETKINPNIEFSSECKEYVNEDQNITFDNNYDKKYPFGTVHYLMYLMEKEGKKIELHKLDGNIYSFVKDEKLHDELFSLFYEVQFGQILLRADNALYSSIYEYKDNADVWWTRLEENSNSEYISAIKNYINKQRNDANAEQIGRDMTIFFKSYLLCDGEDGAFDNITDVNGNLKDKIKKYCHILNEIVGIALAIPEKYNVFQGQYKSLNIGNKDGYRLSLGIINNEIPDEKLFSYAVVYGGSSKESGARDQFSYTVNMEKIAPSCKTDADNFVVNLTDREKAIKNINNDYLVEAGAGSGKTTVLVGRMVSMIEQGVPSEQICALTFTRSAAKQMSDRFIKILTIRSKEELSEDEQRTVSIYEDYLGPATEETRRRCRQAIYENAFERKLWCISNLDKFVLEIVNTHNLKNYKGHTSWNWVKPITDNTADGRCELSECITRFFRGMEKEASISMDDFKCIMAIMLDHPDVSFDGKQVNAVKNQKEKFEKFRCGYKAEKKTIRWTFSEICFYLTKLLEGHPEIIDEISYKYFCIDEFQDTSPLQMKMVLLLAGILGNTKRTEGSMFLVGDPKQSIYHFRDADIKCYLSVRNLLKENNFEILSLAENYRSAGKLIDYYNNVFSKVFTEDKVTGQCDYAEMKIANVMPEKGLEGTYVFSVSLDDYKFQYYSVGKETNKVDERISTVNGKSITEYWVDDKWQTDDYNEIERSNTKYNVTEFIRPQYLLNDKLLEIIAELLRQNDEILILYNDSNEHTDYSIGYVDEIIRDIAKLSGREINNLREESRDSGEEKNCVKKGQINHSTIHTAKGLEADAVIYIDPDLSAKRTDHYGAKYFIEQDDFSDKAKTGKGYIFDKKPSDETDEYYEIYKNEMDVLAAEDQRKIYVAATRAKKVLFILSDKSTKIEYLKGVENGHFFDIPTNHTSLNFKTLCYGAEEDFIGRLENGMSAVKLS